MRRSHQSTEGDPVARPCFGAQPADDVRRLLEVGVSRCEILTRLATAGEVVAGPGAAVSILVLDQDGLLRNGASPNLPADYLDAIDRLKPDPAVGTCAAAAATGSVVMTPDFKADNKWAELRHLPMALGFVGAWSVPIKSPAGKVLGTFGTYFRDRRTPADDERTAVERLAAAAALVLEN
jgi:GAF domain-containing protein